MISLSLSVFLFFNYFVEFVMLWYIILKTVVLVDRTNKRDLCLTVHTAVIFKDVYSYTCSHSLTCVSYYGY